MIKQKIILKYIVISLVVIISVLGVGMAIYKPRNNFSATFGLKKVLKKDIKKCPVQLGSGNIFRLIKSFVRTFPDKTRRIRQAL